MKKILWFISLYIILVSCKESFYLGKIDKTDNAGKRHGLWIKYWDDDKTIPMSKLWYKHGKEEWLTKSYHNNGNIAVKFKSRKKRLKVKYYDRFKHISHKGWAIYENKNGKPHYYWQGEWKYFDTKHNLIKKTIYKDGAELKVLFEKE